MREVSCRPVRSEDDTFTGAPRCSRMLTFRSRSIPDTCRGDVFAADQRTKTKNIRNTSFSGNGYHDRIHEYFLFASDSTVTGLATVYKLLIKSLSL